MAHFMSGSPPTPFEGKDGLELLILLHLSNAEMTAGMETRAFCVLGDCPDLYARHQLCSLWLKSRICGLKWIFAYRILQVLSGQTPLRSIPPFASSQCPVLKEAVTMQGTVDSFTFAVFLCVTGVA